MGITQEVWESQESMESHREELDHRVVSESQGSMGITQEVWESQGSMGITGKYGNHTGKYGRITQMTKCSAS